MKWRCGLLSVLVWLASQTPAGAVSDLGWDITRFSVRIVVESDGTTDVTETIDARFDVPKHGIFREIPVRYDVNGHLYDMRLHLKSVTNGSGTGWKYSIQDVENRISIKIGDPKTTLTGVQTYEIHYRVSRAVLWEGEHAVLRWNATGTEWRVPIHRAEVTVVLPRELSDSEVQYDAWTGRYGAKQKDFTERRIDGRTLKFETGRLEAGEGITVEVAMPGTVVEKPSLSTRLGWWLADNFIYGLIPGGLAACFGLWWLRGRDDIGHGSIVVGYEPPDQLGPAEVGTLIDESVDLRDISAILIDLAVRGYLKIEEVEKAGMLWGKSTDYVFHKKKSADGLKDYERLVYNKIFDYGSEVNLSDLQNKFYNSLPKVKKLLYTSLSQGGYFDGKPDTVRTTYLLVGLALMALAMVVAMGVQHNLIGRVFMLPVIVTGIALLVMVIRTSQVMPRRTRQGRIAWEKIRGLEEFISRAEVDDLKTQERQLVFERLLPYATVFKLTTRWAKAFEGLYLQPPDWYQPASNGPFNMYMLGSSIDNSVSAMNATLPSAPRSEGSGSSGWSSGGFSGGGSSGGGFGGGGGGSW